MLLGTLMSADIFHSFHSSSPDVRSCSIRSGTHCYLRWRRCCARRPQSSRCYAQWWWRAPPGGPRWASKTRQLLGQKHGRLAPRQRKARCTLYSAVVKIAFWWPPWASERRQLLGPESRQTCIAGAKSTLHLVLGGGGRHLLVARDLLRISGRCENTTGNGIRNCRE